MARILTVDDDPDIIEASRIFLEKEGHAVSTASSREEGMKAVASVKPNLLMLDVMMDQPDDGLAMAQDLRQGGYAGPILMLTSLTKVSGFDYDKDGDLVPVDDFQTKPIDPRVLVQKVNALLSRRKK